MGTALCGTARAVGPGVATAYIECRGCRHRRLLQSGLAGLVIGVFAVVAVRYSERQQPPIPEAAQPPAIPAGVADVLAVLRSSGIVVDAADEVVKTSPSATSYGLVKGRELAHAELRHLARQVRRDGVIRESELDLARPGGSRAGHHARPGRAVGQQPRAAAARRHHPGPPAGGDPPRLRRQRQPRAQDPGRWPGAAGRGCARRPRRPGGRRAVCPAHAGRVRPAGTARQGDRRAVAAAGGRHPPRAASGGPDRGGARGHRALARRRGRCQIELVEVCEPDLKVFGDDRLLVTAVRNLVGNAIAYSDPGTRVAVGGRPQRRPRRGHRLRPGPRHPRERAGAHLRALLPRRRRALAIHRRHRARAGHRQAHLRQPRRRRQRLEPGGARVHLSRSACPLPRTVPRRAPRPARASTTNERPTNDPNPRGRGRDLVLRPAVLPAAQGGLRGGRRRDRACGPGGVRPLRVPTSSCSTSCCPG